MKIWIIGAWNLDIICDLLFDAWNFRRLMTQEHRFDSLFYYLKLVWQPSHIAYYDPPSYSISILLLILMHKYGHYEWELVFYQSGEAISRVISDSGES